MKDILNNIYHSNKYGPFKIVEIYEENNIKMARLIFENSQAETTTRLSRALNGEVRDPNYGLSFSKIYYSDNYGPYQVINIQKGAVKTPPKATIQFLNSNNVYIVQIQRALNGAVSDRKNRAITPIDTTILSDIDKQNRLLRIAHDIWYSMIKRCYNTGADNYEFYGGAGVTVCDYWLLFDNFLSDIVNIPQYNKWSRFPTIYRLDKDYLQLNINKDLRVYSLETCMFLHFKDNINLKAIEFRNNNKMNSPYYGVSRESKSTYSAHLIINNRNIYLGTFTDEIVAANVYNYWYEYYHQYELVPLLNNVPYIPNSEFIKYNTRPKNMCTILERKIDL